ncbi:MAG: hypothetical protein AB1631_25525 [Acidobacteriota bacterium]
MPLQLPDLDDRRYADLVEEARALIPTHAPEWTNHNPSDAGITIIELFAYLSEMLIYRLNRVTSANVLSFLKLLNGPDWIPLGKTPQELTPAEIIEQIPATINKMRRLERAVSREDFETLALRADERTARALCLPRRNLEADLERDRPGHVSVIVLPKQEAEAEIADIIKAVSDDLAGVPDDPQKPAKVLLTTHLHVVEPRYLTVEVKATVAPLPDVEETAAKKQVVDAVKSFFDPHTGGESRRGWPFGRNVFVSEVFSLLDQLPGIDFVEKIDVKTAAPGRAITNDAKELIGLEVKPYELVKAQITEADVTVEIS